MGIRMVPIGSLFSRFRRLVRDLSKDLGKEVQLTTSGEETELDKTVIERLHDPLVHLIRNSMDHGIGMPDQREEQGKPRMGTVHLSAVHSGAQVLISISDDGRGIDPVRVRAKAEENGLIIPGAELSDNELYQLIFQPGFSTAEKITNVSGRGVGMDVVKRAIDSLRGTIDVTSAQGEGSTITLRLPLTLAIIDGLLVRVGEGRYVIPLSAVEECVELRPEDDLRATGRDFLNIRDVVVPFLRLRRLFNVAAPADPYQKVVIVSAGETRVGLAVDQIIGDHQTVIKSLSKLHAGVQTFSGATILGDGTVALILDVPRLIDYGQSHESQLKAS
jgi:two-component system chemotaxis sensor kinase CheA